METTNWHGLYIAEVRECDNWKKAAHKWKARADTVEAQVKRLEEQLEVLVPEISMLHTLCKDAAEVVAYHDREDQAVLPRLRAVVEKNSSRTVGENPLSKFKLSTENEGV